MFEVIYEEIEFLEKLKEKYGVKIKPEIVQVIMRQAEDGIFLDTIENKILENGLEKRTIKSLDLAIISDDDGEEELETIEETFDYFNVEDSIEVNVDKFINELDSDSIEMTMDLFID